MSKRIFLHGSGGLTRRGAVCIGTAAGIAASSVSNLCAIEPIPLALPDFVAGTPDVAELASSIPRIISDLSRYRQHEHVGLREPQA